MANFAQLGIQINSNADDAASELDRLTAAGGRAEQSTKRLTKATQDEEKAIADLLGKIDPTVSALDRLDKQERQLANFRKSGRIDTDTYTQYNQKLQEQRMLLGGVSDAQNKAGMSTRAYSAAMRNVPAQITDITTSLIGGQPAYLVALQQGGQLKDMFGGIGPAARALTSSLVSMINPVTILAAVVGTLGVAWYQASNAEFEFNKALIQTGDYANLSGKSVSAMADAMGRLDGITRGGAASAIMAVASSGKIAADNFDLVSVAAAKMASSAGSSIDSTVAKFESIAKEPVSALLKLNETEHFLTNAQLARVDALVKEGNETAAVSLATQIYAGHLDDVDSKIRSSMPAMVQWWRNVKDEISSAWGELAEFGGLLGDVLAKAGVSKQASSTGATFLTPIVGQLKMATGLLDVLNREGAKFWGTGGASTPQVRMAGIYSPDYDQVDSKAYEAGKKAKEAADAANKAWQQTLASTDKAVAQRLALADIQERGKKAGIAQVEIEKQKSAYIKQQADAEAKKSASAARGDISGAQSLIDSANRQIDANKQLAQSGEAVSASRRKIIEIDQRLAEAGNLMTAAQRAQLDVAKQQLEATDKLAKARQQLTRDSAANAAMEERLAAASRQQQEQNEVSLMGIGRGSDATAMAQRQLDIRRDYLKQIDDLEKAQRNNATALSATELQKEKDMLAAHLQSQLAQEQSYQNQRMAMLGDWRNGANAAFEDYAARAADVSTQFKSLFEGAFQGAEDAFVKFVMTGKLSFSDLAKSIIADLARIAAKQAIVGAIGSIVGSIAGGIATSAGNAAVSQGTQNINQQISNDWFSRNGFSNGGYTGDGGKYQAAGTVHKGEVVWSQADVKAVGGPQRANAMRPTAGYANGGIVGASQPRSVGQGAAPQITFIMSMQDGSISSNQQGGGADGSTRELKQMFEAMISQWWAKNNRPGGAVYNGRMGTA